MSLWRRNIITISLQLFRIPVLQYLAQIAKTDHLPPERVTSHQAQKLSKLLQHASRSVPYYKKILAEASVCRNGKIFLDNFDQIPILTKDIIQAEFENLKSNDIQARKWYENSSGGSSGRPVTFLQDKDYKFWNIANKLYLKEIGEQQMGDRELRLWGSERDIIEGRDTMSLRFRNWLYNRNDFNSFLLSEQKMTDLHSLWKSFQPHWVEGYVQSIYEFAKFVLANNIHLPPPLGILTSAGTLYDEMHESIKTAFHAPIYNRYGSREVGDMACSCSKNDCLHLAPWNHYIEILDDNLKEVAPETMGNVHVTLLTNYSMPLIRYKIGDIAVRAKTKYCDCGRNSPIIAKVVGRDVHLFRTSNGTNIDGEYFTHLFYFKNWVKKFQVVQKTHNIIEIKIVQRETPPAEDISQIEQNIRIVMGANCRINWLFPDIIPPLKSGKYLYTISELV